MSRMKERAILEVQDLKVEAVSDRNIHPILHGISFNVKRGEVIGLIGESGAGKSTIGLALLGISRPGCRFCGGSVVFDGVNLLGLSEAQRRKIRGSRIAYVAQSAAASFNPALKLIDQTVERATQTGEYTRAYFEKRAVEIFRKLDLPNPETIGQRYPHQVSGGQLQRIMTAMALMTDPDVVIFDEPTTALDVTTQVQVLAAIRSTVADLGTSAIYISHDLAIVAQMADRIIVLKDGKIEEEAPTRQMLSSPVAEYTRSLWAVRKLDHTPAAASEPLLSIDNLSAAYGHIKVLDGVSMRVDRSHTLTLVGESGSGKSTLGRVIAGFLPPLSGEIRLGKNVLPGSLKQRDVDLRRAVQLIYQSADTALNPKHSVEWLIGRPLTAFLNLKGEAKRKRLFELMSMMELSLGLLHRRPGELSGGQKQRVAIARALAANPQLIICDEITSALDQIVQENILKTLMRVQKESGVSYLFITHDIATVRAIADEVVVLQAGKIVEQGRKDEIFTPPHAPYTEQLLASVPQMDPDWLTGYLATHGSRQSQPNAPPPCSRNGATSRKPDWPP
ncbi:ABC transporter ATP-binding protein (plasmid) [Mesorhizobium sp. ORM8.1]